MQHIDFGKHIDDPLVLCLGYFGCMHLGHVKLVQTAKSFAKASNAKVALFTFSNNHLALLGKENKVLYTFDERLSLYEKLGVDCVISAQFDQNFRDTTGGEFVNKLCEYNLKGVVCGFDYSCGRDRLNGYALTNLLRDVCPVRIVDEICIDGIKVSTTLVRKLLSENNIYKANTLLSEPYFICGKVAHGRGMGNTIGFPTANVEVSEEKYLPQGVYGGYATVDGKWYKAIVNVGDKPTFQVRSTDVEAHLINFDGDLYDKTVKISLTAYLRPICKFDTPTQLAEQLNRDKEQVLND